ncbi:hypothetical protein [Streptomyces sp. NPDC088196]|uniref:hypothetical protein n=1 Tax=Streptomyces sp. NPDC088196 TaxID=3154868 RepID=UPI00344F8A41
MARLAELRRARAAASAAWAVASGSSASGSGASATAAPGHRLRRHPRRPGRSGGPRCSVGHGRRPSLSRTLARTVSPPLTRLTHQCAGRVLRAPGPLAPNAVGIGSSQRTFALAYANGRNSRPSRE